MSVVRAWVLNLAAEAELADPGATTLSGALKARVTALRGRLGALVPEGDRVLGDPPEPCPGALGRAWCPTPSALRVLRDAGAVVPPAPPWRVLREANHRAFCAELGQTLPGAVYATTEAEVLGAAGCGRWVLKRPLGYRGNGRRVLDGAPSEEDLRWVRASLRGGDGLQVEPWVERLEDYALHGFLSLDGVVTCGEPTRQVLDPSGAWVASERFCETFNHAELQEFLTEFDRVGAALRGLGYHGPFGVDAFLWRDGAGVRRWNPRCEVNARYTMGWAVGMGDRRPDL